MTKKELSIKYAWTLIGSPYIWGGESSLGFDCSGLAQEILRSVGMDPQKDQTAQTLHDLLLEKGWAIQVTPEQGSFIFYGKSSKKITHVSFCIECIGEDAFIIEAGGGGGKVTTPEQARFWNAFVRIRPYDYRSDVVSILEWTE